MTVIDDRTPPPGARWSHHAWWVYGLLGGVAIVVYYLAVHSGYLFNAIGLFAPLAILVAVRIHRPPHRLPWHLLALGMALFIAGDVITYHYQELFGVEASPRSAMHSTFRYTPAWPSDFCSWCACERRGGTGPACSTR